MARAASGIEVVDVDLASYTPWSDALGPISRRGERLLGAFNSEGRKLVGPTLWFGLQQAAAILNGAFGGVYGNESSDIADALGVTVPEVVLANVAYDINNVGCSTIAAATPEGPLHARNLDWPFPRGLLKRNLIVARMRNARHGDYALVTWPGVFGALTGIAPGRFSITVNFVVHDEDSSKTGLAQRAVTGYWPVAWAVRRAFDEAGDFAAAVSLLKKTFLLAPVLLTVVGTKNEQRAVIEAACDEYAIRKPVGLKPLVVTNHYESDEMADHNDGFSAQDDTKDRLTALQRRLDGKAVTAKSALAALSAGDIKDDTTQHQVVMQPATGRLVVRVPGSPAVEVPIDGKRRRR